MTTPAWIGLGSNLGDRRAILESALVALAETPGVIVKAVSSFHETSPVGGPPGQGPFLNAAAHLETTLDPHQLLAALQRIEDEAGRVRIVRWGERTLDLDILIFGTRFLDSKELKLPHPRMAFRRFVLAPLAEIAPQIVDTMTKRTIEDLLANLDRRPRLLTIEGASDLLKQRVFRRLEEELPAFAIAEADMTHLPGSDEGGFSAFCATLENKVQTLRSDYWATERLRVPWMIVDFSIGFDLQRLFRTNWWKGPSQENRDARRIADHARMRHLQERSATAVQPTLVLLLNTNWVTSRKPGVSNVPQLWPESSDPDAIVAEVLATCRGIESV